MPSLRILRSIADLRVWARADSPGSAVARVHRGSGSKARLTPRIEFEPRDGAEFAWWGQASEPVASRGAAFESAVDFAENQLDVVCAEVAVLGWQLTRSPRIDRPKRPKRPPCEIPISDGHRSVLLAAAKAKAGKLPPTTWSKLGLDRELVRDAAARGWVTRDARGCITLLPAGRRALRASGIRVPSPHSR